MNRELRWLAQYADGRIVKELDFTGSWVWGKWTETPFRALDLSQIVSFGLEGSGTRVGFRVDNGVIGINGKPLELALQDFNNNLFPITGRQDVFYRVVQYKEAHCSISSGNGKLKEDSGIDAYCVGWTTASRDKELGDWRSKCVVRVPSKIGEEIKVYLWFMCSNGFTGILRIRFGDMEYPPINTILRPGTANRIVIHVGD